MYFYMSIIVNLQVVVYRNFYSDLQINLLKSNLTLLVNLNIIILHCAISVLILK